MAEMISREISIGYLKLMTLSAPAEERSPSLIDSCQTTVRNHCCETRKLTAWDSVP